MFSQLTRLFRTARRDRRVGLTLLMALSGVAILGNTLTFFVFERLADRDISIFDSL